MLVINSGYVGMDIESSNNSSENRINNNKNNNNNDFMNTNT